MEVLKSKVELLKAQNAWLSKELQRKEDEKLQEKLGKEGEEGGEEEQNMKEGEEEASQNDEYYIIRRCNFDGGHESGWDDKEPYSIVDVSSQETDLSIISFSQDPDEGDPYLCIGEKWINAWQIRDVLFKLELEDDALDIYFGILEDEQSPTKWYYVSSWAQKTLKDSHPLLEDAASAESYMNALTGFFRDAPQQH
ncbi:hypothetical protein QJS10_CPA01g01925 [Acorus calamus]|uniref:Uncharacterized protein n=1 Tax=Acorus calamus TaxID=4465 RepID=A0AAV9FGV5_ACOCL|nr:hypothetical protein QJS10_CPA01g01925 [Acorus calamus]